MILGALSKHNFDYRKITSPGTKRRRKKDEIVIKWS